MIYNGVDTRGFAAAQGDRAKFNLPADAFLLLFVGDLRTPRKNLGTVLEALRHLPDHVHIAVAGYLPGSPYPEEARALGIADRVHFLGLVKEMPVLMHSVDAFVFPSRYEAMSLSLLEAMAAGLPVVPRARATAGRGDHHARMRHRARRSGRSQSARRPRLRVSPNPHDARRAWASPPTNLRPALAGRAWRRNTSRCTGNWRGNRKTASEADYGEPRPSRSTTRGPNERRLRDCLTPNLHAQRDTVMNSGLNQIVANRHALVPGAGGRPRPHVLLAGWRIAGRGRRGARRGGGLAARGGGYGRRDPGFRLGGAIVAAAPDGGAPRAAPRDQRQRPDVISSHFALYTFPGLDVTRGIPQVSHFQGPWADESHVEGADSFGQRAKRYLEQSVYARSSRLIVLSDAFGKILTSRYGISPERVRVVPGCVNVEQFNLPITPAEARLKLQLPQGRPIVLAVRRLVRRMGLEDLIDAVKLLKQRVPDVLLLIAGKGRLQEELQTRINEAGLDDNVKLLGFVPDQHLAALYRAATISVVPTVALEGFGLITVESLASGTPVLVTPVGGLPEAVAGLSPDLVLPATGAAAIAEGLAGSARWLIEVARCRSLPGYTRGPTSITR